ncbi:MAG: hypothetical protein Q9162_000991 [Coniocarpon cinnabarinum]
MNLSALPDELISSILSFLEPDEVVLVQLISRRFKRLARDSNLWKNICFEHSRYEYSRRRHGSATAQAAEDLVRLQDAITGVASSNEDFADSNVHVTSSISERFSPSARRKRALISWDPSHSNEKHDFYDEFRQRHAPIAVDWFEESNPGRHAVPIDWYEGLKSGRHAAPVEATGLGCLTDDENVLHHVVAPMENDSLCVWQASSTDESGISGCLKARSQPGLLSAEHNHAGPVPTITNDTGAIENVSIDSKQRRGYFAVHDTLAEVDLQTLQVISRSKFSFPISCISRFEPLQPMTVGTTHTLNLFDPRARHQQTPSEPTEQIAGTNTSLFSSLTEPGPLSILHHPLTSASNEIWVGGRFKSLLCYDRRFWPRVSKTMFSGARLSSISALPYPFLSRSYDLTRNPGLSINDHVTVKSAPGATLMAAGEYKGKGSLELYNLAPSPDNESVSYVTESQYRNRQTISRTRLLSIAPHGSRIVFTDGDGCLKWMERDGSTLVREFNINDYIPWRRRSVEATRGAEIRTVYHDRAGADSPMIASSDDEEAEGLFAEGENGDMIQRVIPTGDEKNDLLIWTADGRLGIVGFGRGRGAHFGYRENSRTRDQNRKTRGSRTQTGGDGMDESDEEEQKERAERLFGMRMRRALERQADEARFVRSLGMGGRYERG